MYYIVRVITLCYVISHYIILYHICTGRDHEGYRPPEPPDAVRDLRGREVHVSVILLLILQTTTIHTHTYTYM